MAALPVNRIPACVTAHVFRRPDIVLAALEANWEFKARYYV